MLVIGLTGGIGAGKSTVAALLAERGAEVVDVDAIGRAVIAPGTPGAEAVTARFGTAERPELARIVFGDPTARHDLEAISWPRITDELRARIEASTAEVVVLDMAVLAQGLGAGLYGPAVTVEAPDELRVQRLLGRGMDEADARARIASQTSEAQRRALADHVIVNDGDLAALARATTAVLDALLG